MMNHKVTALRLQKKNHQRVNVYLDGKYAFGLARIVAAWLQIGQEISDEKIAQLQAEDSREATYQRALRFISYRPRSEAEMRQKLAEREVSEENIEETLQRLKRAGLLSDGNFAQQWVESRSAARPRGRRALAYELEQRGVDRQTIDQALASVDEEELAYQAACKRARRLKDLEWKIFRHKMFRFMAQRGFDYEVCSQVISRVWDELHNNENPSNEEGYP
ncbi:MAG: RecX family transcriptional regulator [Anaerolineales bacterium]|nr:RecX family transcriptional regulator [Anaerolineales bacterium]